MGRDRGRTPLYSVGLRRLRLGSALLLVALAGCATPTSGTMRGIVVDLAGDLTSVEAFTVLVEGEQVVFTPTPDGEYAFPLSHLQEHLRTGEPVLVGWELVDDRHVATSLEDG